MKQKLLNSIRLRALLLVATLLVGGANFNLAWATFYKSYTGGVQQAITTISASNVSSGSVGIISWTGTGCTYSSSRVNIEAKGSITFTASSGYLITKIVIVSGSTSSYYGTWTSSPSITPSSSSGTTTFDGLSTQSVTVTTSTSFRCTSQSSISIYYVNAAPTYALTIEEPEGGTITVLDESANEVSSGDKFQENAELTISAEACDGYTFSTWTKTAGTFGSTATTADNTFTMPAEAATIGATFTKNSYNLSLSNTNGSCAVTVDGDDWDGSSEIPYNAEVEITATPNDGYLFGEWTSTDIGDYDEVTNPLTFNMPASDVEIAASFVDASSYYSITVDDDVTGGTISADKASAAEGVIITLTATPSTGYTFTSWTVKDAGDNAITVNDNKFTMPASNVTVTATFTAIAVTGVTLNKTSASISVGETETLTATVAPSNALNKAVTWTSSNTSVATVSNGTVTAVAAGSATITVTTTDGSFTATCTVTVVNAVTFDATKDTGTSPIEKSGVTFTCDNGVLNNSSEYRLYKNSETTFSVSTGKITKIEFTGVSGNPASGFANQSGWTTDGNDGTWTGKSSSVSFTASGAQVRATEIKVYIASTATPTFSVTTGEYSEAKSVEINCDTDGATIYYTTDGTDPDEDSDEYTSAIPITETTTLKAIAIKDEVESDVASATYTMNRPAAPTFDVATCVFDAAFDLHLSAADGTTIYYTTDGTTPTSGSSAYSTKVAISTETTTVKAIAVKDGLTSDVASATYTYDSRITPTFSLSTTSLDLKVNDTSDAVTLTTNSDGDVTFSCDDAHVTLTGTGNSRTISANAAGEYTVNVTVTNSDDYKDAAGTITVNVTKKATMMVLTPSFTSKDLYVTTSGSVTGVPQYNSSDIDGAAVTYSSSDTKVATIASNGAITFKKAGTTTITVSYEGDGEYEECEASYVLYLTDSTPQATEVNITLNNAFFGCSSFTSWTTGMATTLSGESKNITVTYTKGTSANMYCSSEKVRFYTDNTFTIEAPVGYHIISVDMNVSISSATPSGTISSDTWTGDADAVSFTFANKTDISSITVTLAETVTIGTAGYTTYVAKHDISFPYGVTAYISTTKTSETLTLTEKASVPEGIAVILKGDAGTYALPTIKITPESVDGNLLQASDGSVTGDGSTIYALAKFDDKVGFYQVNNGIVIPAGKAYLVDGAGVKGFTFDFDDDDATAIEKTLSDSPLKDENIYNLAGQRLGNSQLKRGIYIVNGKKVMVK